MPCYKWGAYVFSKLHNGSATQALSLVSVGLKSVVIVNDSAAINGGQAKVAVQSAIGLKKAGLNVTYFAASGPVSRALSDANVETFCLGQKDLISDPNRASAFYRGLWNPVTSKALKAQLDAFDPETTITHCHGFSKALSPSIGPVLTDGRIAHVFTMHEYFLACPNGAFFNFQKKQICQKRALSSSCIFTHCDARKASHKAWRLARQAMLWKRGKMPRDLQDVIYLSDTQLKTIRDYLPEETRMHFVANPTGPKADRRVQAEDNDIFLFIGRLAPEKGCTLLAQAAKMAGVKIVFVGEGAERDAILEANPEAVITGWLEPAEVEGWLRKARCLVFPSLWYETFGLTPREALNMGVPVICGAWTAACEYIDHEKDGLIVETRELDDWVSAIKTIDQSAKHFSENAYQSKALQTSISDHADQLLAVYDICLKKQKCQHKPSP